MTQHNTTARATRRADGHFTTIANAAIRDPRLSWKAKGILAGALSHGPGFRFNREWFMRNGTDGSASVRSAMQELREHGYLATEVHTGPDGRKQGSSLHFCDDPKLLAEAQEILQEAENRQAGYREAENPPGGSPATIRRSIERTPTEEDQEPPLPPAGGKHVPDPLFIEHITGKPAPPASSGTLVVVPQSEPAPSPKRNRMAKPSAFAPTPDDIPAALLPVEAPLMAFWAEKGGKRTKAAWGALLGNLERIQSHMDGGTQVVAQQLDNAIQSGWTSVTFSNWQKWGQPAPARSGGGPRKSATDQAADRVLAMFRAQGIA